jgi:hypothetical protein
LWPSFTAWALHEAATQLSSGSVQQQTVALIIKQLPGYYDCTNGLDYHDIPVLLPTAVNIAVGAAVNQAVSEDGLESLWKSIDNCQQLKGRNTPLGVLSCLLRASDTCVLYFVDEAETLFDSRKYSWETAKLWMGQLQSTLAIVQSAVGVVVCASFQRARQLFLSDGQPHELPDYYQNHSSLRSNWNGDKFTHIRVPSPTWSARELAWFILVVSRRISTSGPAANLSQLATEPGQGAAGRDQQASSAVGGAQQDKLVDAKAAVIPPTYQRSLLEDAQRLDTQFLRTVDTETTARETLESSLTMFLAIYGNTLRRLVDAIGKLYRQNVPCQWPSAGPSRHVHAVAQGGSAAASSAFEAYISLLSPKLETITHLNYDAETFSTTESALVGKVASGLTGGHFLSPAEREKEGFRCIDAALDASIFRYLADGSICLSDPAFYIHRVCHGVSPTLVGWMQHPGYGEEAELVLARALRRRIQRIGLPGMNKLDNVHVFAWDDAGSVLLSNEDSTAPSKGLASVAVVALELDEKESEMIMLTAKAVCEKTTISVFRKESMLSTPAKTKQRAWKAARKSAKSIGVDCPRVLAAFLAAKKTHADILCKIGMAEDLTPLLVKETPDAHGGDLIGIFPREVGENLIVDIFRIQVKVATQKNLRAGKESDASRDRCLEAVSIFLGGKALMSKPDAVEQKEIKRLEQALESESPELRTKLETAQKAAADKCAEHQRLTALQLAKRHYSASRAIADLVLMSATLAHVEHSGLNTELSADLALKFSEFEKEVIFHHHPPVLLTTHTVCATTRSMAERYGVNVLDASALQDSWGDLGRVCKSLRILPFAAPTEADTQKEGTKARLRKRFTMSSF